MREKLEEAFWRLEAELLAPSRSLKAFRGSLGSFVSTVEKTLSEEGGVTPENEALTREELAHLGDLCLCLRRCRWRSALTQGWAAKHLPGIVSSEPGIVSSKPGIDEAGVVPSDAGVVSTEARIGEAGIVSSHPGIVSSPPGIVSCEAGVDDVEALLRRQAEVSCSEGPTLLLAIRSRCLLVTAVAALLVFVQANITGPPFSPASATEKLEMEHDEEGRQKHPDLYAPKPAAAAAAGGTCCCCCSFCGFCPRGEALAATAAAAAKGVLRQRRCYCEFELDRHSSLLGSPMETTTETAKRIPAVAAVLSIDGEAVYEDVRGLAYLWFARLLFKTLETLQLSAGAPQVFPGASKNAGTLAANPAAAPAAAAAGAGAGDRLSAEGLGFRGPLTLFVWRARADFLLQKTLRSGGGASGSIRASVAPSLVETVLLDFAAVLQQLRLLPQGFSCTSSEAVDMERLLEAADLGSLAAKKSAQEVKKFKQDVAGLVLNQKGRFCLVPPLPAEAATAADAAAPAATTAAAASHATRGSARLLLRHALEDFTCVDFAALLPDPQWMTTRDKTLLLLELALRLAVFGRAEVSDAVNNMACECFGVEFVLTGAPGIRRKYQKEALPQLVVSAAPKKGGGPSPGAKREEGPHVGAPLPTAETCLPASHRSSSSSNGSSNIGSSSVASDKDKCSSNANSSSSSSSSWEVEKQTKPISDGGEETCATERASSDSEVTPAESRRRLWRLEDVRGDTDIMERPALASGVDWETFERPLGVTEQALLLSKSRAIIESSPCNDPLALEELGAVVSRALVLPPSGSTAANSKNSSSMQEYFKRRHSFLLSQPPEEFTEEPACQLLSPDWVVFSGGLWLRCCAEFHRTKTVERACLQLHALCEQLLDADPPACYRLFGLLFHADLLSWWELQREVAVRMMRIGATITAAEKFTQLKMWEEAADCLIAADRRADARAILEQQIAERPTAHLLCALGDLEKQENPERAEQLFKQAWELSGGRFAKAQRALGFFFLRQQRFAEAAASLRLATAVNTLHAQSWFALGCCCMQLGEDLEARAAFAHVVAIDPQEGDAWANLAAVHCKREAWSAAQQCITEAAKHRRDSWRVWQTFISICVKTRDVQAIGRGLRMLVDINAKSRIDPWIYSVLEELVLYHLNQQGGSAEEQSKAIQQGLLPGVLRQTLSCLQYLTQHISDSPELFRVYGVLLVKAHKLGDAVNSWLKEFRTLQAALTRGDASPRSRWEMAERQVTALERAVSLLSASSEGSATRNDLLQQLRTTVETHEKRVDEEANEVKERLESLLKRVSALQQQATTSGAAAPAGLPEKRSCEFR